MKWELILIKFAAVQCGLRSSLAPHHSCNNTLGSFSGGKTFAKMARFRRRGLNGESRGKLDDLFPDERDETFFALG